MHDLWTLALRAQTVDPDELASAIARQVESGDLDFRTRLLIRDALDILEERWGSGLEHWMEGARVAGRLLEIRREDLGETGFPTLGRRVMRPTTPKEIEQLLRDLGQNMTRPARIVIGGSVSLILRELISRKTEDIDVVDEVPLELRSLGRLLDEVGDRYGVRLAHFQSHYLPAGWAGRTQSIGTFGRLQVSLVDAIDVFLSKLFSKRSKDLDDLRYLEPQLEKQDIVRRLNESTKAFLCEEQLRANAEKNWYIVYGEDLPVAG